MTAKPDPKRPRRKRLRRSDCSFPGLRRLRQGRGFRYLDEQGKRVTDPDTRQRIRELAIPPAWNEVWICPIPNGHLQAVGTDAKGRRQYLYHERWRQRRDRQKFEAMVEFARASPGGRDTTTRPRLLPRWRRRVRRGQRDVRTGDDEEAACLAAR